ncbi:MAG TPA: 3'(2'),5'-bisphosphate nucleotidase CysQ [Gemmataceae bacterium]|nr:3'(2'),5'-bisphosphate nucleotidase CysQ [Gemmataceae bacterium]
MSYELELKTALEAAEKASKHLLDAYARFEVVADAPASITTDADRQSQEIILQHLHRAFPGDALCAEEQTPTVAQAAQTGSRLWIVDPIDGTRGFARKVGEFSVMIGFVVKGELAVGVVQEPAKSRLTWAVRGGGCWKRDGAGAATRCHVTTISDLSASTLTQSHSQDPNKPSRRVQLLKPAKVIETYSAGVKLALVARGEADLYLNTYDAVHDWDMCAGHVLVDEAGGRVTKLNGDELKYGLPGALQQGGTLASNGRLHEAAMARMK